MAIRAPDGAKKNKSIAANLYYYNVQYGVLSIAWCMFGFSHMYLLERNETLDIDSLQS